MFALRAMNTDVLVAAPLLSEVDEESVARRVADVFASSERIFSRFRPNSELSLLNAATGQVTVSAEMFAALRRARTYNALTGGLFDPAVGGALLAFGYDRSFAPGALDRESAKTPRRASFGDVVLDRRTRSVFRPRGVHLDLGGMVKGRTVDRAARLLPSPGVVDAGGDAVFLGAGPDGTGWLVDVEDPRDASRSVATLRLCDCAVATSAPNRRHWRVGTARMHHIVDPRSHRPAESDLAQATVIAPTAELADVLAKTAFILGARLARAFLERMPRVGGVLVLPAGEVQMVGKAMKEGFVVKGSACAAPFRQNCFMEVWHA